MKQGCVLQAIPSASLLDRLQNPLLKVYRKTIPKWKVNISEKNIQMYSKLCWNGRMTYNECW